VVDRIEYTTKISDMFQIDIISFIYLWKSWEIFQKVYNSDWPRHISICHFTG